MEAIILLIGKGASIEARDKVETSTYFSYIGLKFLTRALIITFYRMKRRRFIVPLIAAARR
jgi:hypothetical protein